MKTDKELLELAAKAAGIEYVAISTNDGRGLLIPPMDDVPLDKCNLWWNPLTDDGDALRLAVQLRIAIKQPDPHASHAGWTADYGDCPITSDGNGPWFWKEWHNDISPYAATRRAIVRAAAEIGEAK